LYRRINPSRATRNKLNRENCNHFFREECTVFFTKGMLKGGFFYAYDHISAIHFAFFNHELAIFLHMPDASDHGFYSEAGHIGHLLAGKF